MRLIDAGAIDEEQRQAHGFFYDFDLQELLDEQPTIQPQIVMCKECKHSEHWYKDKRRCFLWAEDGIDVFDDGYCYYADMRDGQK